jgi:hypothetical protein
MKRIDEIAQTDPALHARILRAVVTLAGAKDQTVRYESAIWNSAEQARVKAASTIAKDSDFRKFCKQRGLARAYEDGEMHDGGDRYAEFLVVADGVISELFPVLE